MNSVTRNDIGEYTVTINNADTLPPPAPKPRGFAWLKANRPERYREICSAGGKAAQATGRCHRFTLEEARAAGQKGGRICHEKRVGAHKEQGR